MPKPTPPMTIAEQMTATARRVQLMGVPSVATSSARKQPFSASSWPALNSWMTPPSSLSGSNAFSLKKVCQYYGFISM